jgi:hypothetical protein
MVPSGQITKEVNDGGNGGCCVPSVRKIGFLCLLAMGFGSEMGRLF